MSASNFKHDLFYDLPAVYTYPIVDDSHCMVYPKAVLAPGLARAGSIPSTGKEQEMSGLGLLHGR
jgi:hypothetical protein